MPPARPATIPHSSEVQAGIGSPTTRASNNINARPVACATTTTLKTLVALVAIPPLKSAAPQETAAERLRPGETRFGMREALHLRSQFRGASKLGIMALLMTCDSPPPYTQLRMEGNLARAIPNVHEKIV